MAYERHEMNVLLFSKEDAVFTDGDATLISSDDNEWDDSNTVYEDEDKLDD